MAESKKDETKREVLWTPMFTLVLGLSLCGFITGQGSNTGVSVFVIQQGGTAAFAGLLGAVYSVSAGVSRLACGALLDKRGRYFLLVGGAALMFSGVAVPIISTNSAAFVICRIVQGFGFAALTTTAATAAAEVLPLSRLGEGIGYHGLGQALSMTIGPAGALYMLTLGNDILVFVLLSCVAALAFVLSLFCRYEKHPEKLPETCTYRTRYEQAKRASVEAKGESSGPADSAKPEAPKLRGIRRILEPKAFAGAIPALLFCPASAFSSFFAGAYGLYLGVDSAWLYFTLAAVMMVLIRAKSGAFMDKLGSIVEATATLAAGILAFTLFFIAGYLEDQLARSVLFYASGALFGCFNGLMSPVCQTVAMRNSPTDHWGAASATFFLSFDIGMATGGIIWGAINDAFGFSASLIGVMICITVAYASCWILFPANEKHLKRDQSQALY